LLAPLVPPLLGMLAGLSGFAERLYDRESGLPAIWRAAAASQTPQFFR
jgi:hypothetical protein